MPRIILYPSDELIRTLTNGLLGGHEQWGSVPMFFGFTLAGPDQIGVMMHPMPPSDATSMQDVATSIFSQAPRKTLWGFGFHTVAETVLIRTADARGNLWMAEWSEARPDEMVETFRSAEGGVPDDPTERELWVAATALAAL
ncbi:hypothetical protein ACLMAJ_16135 [Nocardia sp. KC 131]|uniref:hypothetical protein n=1 Tax=Nocardia arseniciresistens TaxID=3392119 RepID=UPI00398E44DB